MSRKVCISYEQNIVICANCGQGEEGGINLKSCTACKMVSYCNRDCQIAHRPMHKKECKRRAAELHDEALFQEVDSEECPICFLPHITADQTTFQACCGKKICNGCSHAVMETAFNTKGDLGLCAFCRKTCSSFDSIEALVKRTYDLAEAGNNWAYFMLAGYYAQGLMGLAQDNQKCNELLLKAGRLGCGDAYYNLGISYRDGIGMEADMKKAIHFWELGAMKGNVLARTKLGRMEGQAGNERRAYEHYIIAARAGYQGALDGVKTCFMNGSVTKDEYTSALRDYQKRRDEMWSEQRKAAAEFDSNHESTASMSSEQWNHAMTFMKVVNGEINAGAS